MAWRILAPALLLAFASSSSTSSGASITIPLTGSGWSLRSSTAGPKYNLANVSLPGDVYLSLFENNLTTDPYYRNNDVKLRWISKENWTYERFVDFPSEITQKKSIVLVASGLDTAADVYVNDAPIGQSSNVYRTYIYEIPAASIVVHPSNTSVRIDFASPVNYSRDRAEDFKRRYNYTVPSECPPAIEHGECYANFIRKMHAHYAWDWGPAFPTSGVTGELTVKAFDTCFLQSFSVVPSSVGDRSWMLRTEFWLYCSEDAIGSNVQLRASADELRLNQTWTERVARSGLNRFYEEVAISDEIRIDVWWPNGLGEQKLYEIVGELIDDGDGQSETNRLHVGFRRMELVQDLIPNVANGSTFYVKINDAAVFLKGTNWIPGDSFLSRLTDDRLVFYFESMREANMNCIRVWGGGVYETDRFYQLADQYGIAIWQDMMFAVDLYPANPEFLDNIRTEIEEQINRLKHHPSILIWAGNNENELGLADGWYTPMDAPLQVYKDDYLALYNTTVYGAINRTDFASRPYVLSSPSNGIQTVREGGLSANPGDNMYGDVHFYSYDGDAWNWKKYPTPRCVTEFGFQSFPSMETFRAALTDGDLHYFSPQMIHRQHHPAGEFEMLAQMIRHFKVSPKSSSSSVSKFDSSRIAKKEQHSTASKRSRRPSSAEDEIQLESFKNVDDLLKFEHLVYLSQIHQAVAYKTEVEHYRRWRSSLNEAGEGLTMCSLYWQLNDIWQAPTWASIDYGLKWKMAHYYAKRFYAPVLVSPYIDGQDLKISIVNDLNRPLENLTVVVDTYSWAKFGSVYQANISVPRLDASSAQFLVDFYPSFRRRLNPYFDVNGETLAVVFDTRVFDNLGRQLGPNNVVFPDDFRDLSTDTFGKVNIDGVWSVESTRPSRPSSEEQPRTKFQVRLMANTISPFVWLDVEGVRGYFSDNGFAMVEKYVTIDFVVWDQRSITDEQFRQNLTVKTLGDLYR